MSKVVHFVSVILFSFGLTASSALFVNLRHFRAIFGTDTLSEQSELAVIEQVTHTRCYMTCGADDACQGYNYFSDKRRCQLLEEASTPADIRTSPGSIYMERLDNRFCQDRSVCYVYGKATWDEAYELCPHLHLGATMIQENSDEEAKNHISEAEVAGMTRYWLSLRRPLGGGRYEFYWQPSGDNMTYSRWRSAQPYQGSEDSNCVMASEVYNWTWDDSSCGNHVMYMCQYRPID